MTRSFEDRLRDELMAATARPRRRNSRIVVVSVASAALALTALMTSLDTAAADVEITHQDGRVVVRLTDFANTPEEIEAATEAAGLDIKVDAVPTGPSSVGRFVGQEATSADFENLERIDADGVTFVAFSLPEDWDGSLTLLLGRPAKAGEPYVAFTSAYAPGEPLACTGTLGRPLSELSPYVDGLDVSVQTFGDGRPVDLVPLNARTLAELGAEAITGATALSSSSLIVDVGGLSPTGANPEC